MLTELRITGLGVIDSAVLEPGPGLTVVTGETGAGKTMVVTGLGLVAGGRTDSRSVRTGTARALVEARFAGVDEPLRELVDEAGGVLDGDELLVCRQVAATGRSRALLGGAQVPLSVAAEVGSALITIHGQSEQQRLATGERQRQVLDRAAGAELAEVMTRYHDAYEARRAAMTELSRLRTEARERAREQDLLTFGLDEVAAVDPQPGEDQALAVEAQRLQAVDDLRLTAREAALALAGDDEIASDQASALALAGAARKALELAASHDPAAAALAGQAREVTALLADLAASTSSYLADLDADPLRLEQVTARRAALQSLTRKYGETVDEVLAWAAGAAERLLELQDSDERIGLLEQQVAELTEQVEAGAAQVTELRRAAADRLATAVQTELSALAMPRARLEFALSPLAEPGP
ncbi:MAG: AAA family ATPase, partial [Actinomycetia bacterium]|nr:AAA family ATPase [Actinomycetes bacterium]